MKRTLAGTVIDFVVFLCAVLGVTQIGWGGRNMMAVVRWITTIVILLIVIDDHVAILAVTHFGVGPFQVQWTASTPVKSIILL